MPSLRDYRDKIKSVKSTRKITLAMKMVAASKLRRAQEQAEASQPYASSMAAMLARVAKNVVVSEGSSPLLVGTGSSQRHLLVVVTSDRGLCGGFNGNLVKAVRAELLALKEQGKDISLVCVGRKGRDLLNRGYAAEIEQSYTDITGKKRVEFAEANKVTEYVLDKFSEGAFDVCTLAYNHFESVLSQPATLQQLIPFKLPEVEEVARGGCLILQMLEVGYRVATREELLNMDFSVEQLERFKLTAQKNGEAHIDIPDLPGSSGQAWKRRGHHSYGVLRMKLFVPSRWT